MTADTLTVAQRGNRQLRVLGALPRSGLVAAALGCGRTALPIDRVSGSLPEASESGSDAEAGCTVNCAGVDAAADEGSSDIDASPRDGAPTDAGPMDTGPEGSADSGDSAPRGDGLTNCGAMSESCSTSLEVEGGTFYRTYTNDGSGPTGEADPATVSGFRMDKYLVTVGRFRRFVKAWDGGSGLDGGAGYDPPAGSGKHTHLNGGQGLASEAAPGAFEEGGTRSTGTRMSTRRTALWRALLITRRGRLPPVATRTSRSTA